MTCWKSLTALKEDPCQIIGTTKPRRKQTFRGCFLFLFHFTYRVQYFLTLLLLVKGAGAGQIQSGDRGQVKLNFLELLAKRKSAGPLYEITGNGAIHSRYWIEDTGKVIVNVFRCYWMEGFLQLRPVLEDNPLISRSNKPRMLEHIQDLSKRAHLYHLHKYVMLGTVQNHWGLTLYGTHCQKTPIIKSSKKIRSFG